MSIVLYVEIGLLLNLILFHRGNSYLNTNPVYSHLNTDVKKFSE